MRVTLPLTPRHKPPCSQRFLSPSTGVKSYEVSLENQSAVVVAEPGLSYEKVLSTISKTGKKVNSGEADGIEKSVELEAAA